MRAGGAASASQPPTRGRTGSPCGWRSSRSPATIPTPGHWLRVSGTRPGRALPTAFLDWCWAGLAARGKTALLLVWENAGWHLSTEGRRWLRRHHQAVTQRDHGSRIVACCLPTRSPWLNPHDPRWGHGKRHVADPARLLTADELQRRVCAAFHLPHDEQLTVTTEAA
jgi:hypothetical protein